MKLNDVLVLDDYGIFQAIKKLHSSITIPWLDEAITLDSMYYFHSGEKKISKRLEVYLKKFNNINDALDALAKHISLNYYDSWDKIYNALTMEYNPLENYDANEEEKIASKIISSVMTKMDEASTATGSSKSSGLNKDKSSNNVYGFNSDTGVPKDEMSSEGTAEGSNSSESIGSSSTEGSTTSTTEGNPEENVRTLRRHGNIGVTTSAQMLEGEIGVRIKNRFYNLIMNDVDKMLVIRAY